MLVSEDFMGQKYVHLRNAQIIYMTIFLGFGI